MNQLKSATLATILSEVLANLAFMFTDDEKAEPPAADQWLEAAISYRGPLGGSFHLRCTTGFSVQLAANLLGLDPEAPDAESQARDAVKEFMNILCGQFVTTVHGTEPVFDLSIPEVRELSETPDLTFPDGPELATLSVDGHCVQLAYTPSAA